MSTIQAREIIRRKFKQTGSPATIPLLKVGSFTAKLVGGGVQVDNLGNLPLLPWTAFQEAVSVMIRKGGRARRGDAMQSRLGDDRLPLDSIEGHVASVVYSKKIGDAVFRRIVPIACILIWAGICKAEPNKLVLLDHATSPETLPGPQVSTAYSTKRAHFIPTLQQKVAVTAVGPSALRGQGKGVLGKTQQFLAALPLGDLPKSGVAQFREWLDQQTENLLDRLPVQGRPWGAARKAINLFLRDALYNRYLAKNFGVSQVQQWLEIPLDSIVAKGLRSVPGGEALPRWTGLKTLRPSASRIYQEFAPQHAQHLRTLRVHLDMYLWLENR